MVGPTWKRCDSESRLNLGEHDDGEYGRGTACLVGESSVSSHVGGAIPVSDVAESQLDAWVAVLSGTVAGLSSDAGSNHRLVALVAQIASSS
jgi:hypothetical protein